MKIRLLLLLFTGYNFCRVAYTYQNDYTIQGYQYPVLNQYETQRFYGSNNLNTYQTYNTQGSVYSIPTITYIGVPLYKQYLIRKTYQTSVPLYISKSTADISSLNGQNTNQILKIFVNLNVGEDIKQNILQSLALDSNVNGTYTQYIYQLILRIISLNVDDDVKRTIIKLLSARIQGYRTNGGTNAAEEQTIKNQIERLNVDENNKLQLIQILVNNFKGPQNHINIHGGTQTGTIINRDKNDEYNTNQNIRKETITTPEISNEYDVNKKKIMKIFVEKNVDVNIRNKLFEILTADSKADGTYTQYILELVSRINDWDISVDVQKSVLELLAFRIIQYQENGGYSDADIISVKNEIDNFNTTTSWKNRILECLIMEFTGIQLRATNIATNQPGSQNKIVKTEFPNIKDENQRKIKEIMIVKNIDKNMQNKLLELLAIDSNAGGAYTQYILQLMTQIVSWDINEDVQQRVLELLCLRVLYFQDNGGYTQDKEHSIKNQILQLNTSEQWKKKINQFLIKDFKEQLLQVGGSIDSQSSQTLSYNNMNKSSNVEEASTIISNNRIQNQDSDQDQNAETVTSTNADSNSDLDIEYLSNASNYSVGKSSMTFNDDILCQNNPNTKNVEEVIIPSGQEHLNSIKLATSTPDTSQQYVSGGAVKNSVAVTSDIPTQNQGVPNNHIFNTNNDNFGTPTTTTNEENVTQDITKENSFKTNNDYPRGSKVSSNQEIHNQGDTNVQVSTPNIPGQEDLKPMQVATPNRDVLEENLLKTNNTNTKNVGEVIIPSGQEHLNSIQLAISTPGPEQQFVSGGAVKNSDAVTSDIPTQNQGVPNNHIFNTNNDNFGTPTTTTNEENVTQEITKENSFKTNNDYSRGSKVSSNQEIHNQGDTNVQVSTPNIPGQEYLKPMQVATPNRDVLEENLLKTNNTNTKNVGEVIIPSGQEHLNSIQLAISTPGPEQQFVSGGAVKNFDAVTSDIPTQNQGVPNNNIFNTNNDNFGTPSTTTNEENVTQEITKENSFKTNNDYPRGSKVTSNQEIHNQGDTNVQVLTPNIPGQEDLKPMQVATPNRDVLEENLLKTNNPNTKNVGEVIIPSGQEHLNSIQLAISTPGPEQQFVSGGAVKNSDAVTSDIPTQNQGVPNNHIFNTNNDNFGTPSTTTNEENVTQDITKENSFKTNNDYPRGSKVTSNQEIHNQGVTNVQVSTPNISGQEDLKPMQVATPNREVSEKNFLKTNNPNAYDGNRKKIMELLNKKNVNEDVKKKLLDLLVADSQGIGSYTSYILELISQIERWNVSIDIQRRILEILIDRILKYQINGGFSETDIQTIKNEIEKLNESRSWKNNIIRLLIIDFKGKQLQLTGGVSSENDSQKTVTQSKIFNQNDETIQKMYNIMVLKNVNSDARNSLLKLLTEYVKDPGYNEYILKVITQITNSELDNNIQGQVLHLLILRILQYEVNGKFTEADEQLIKSQIEQLKTTSYWKNIVTRYLINDFKGQLYQVKNNGFNKNLPQTVSVQAVSQKSQDQLEDLNKYGENVKNVMKILIEKNVDENTRKKLLTILVSDTESGGTYTEYIVNIITQIIRWNVSSDAKRKELELLIFRILQYQKNGKYSDADITHVKNEIEQLKISRGWKNVLLNYLIRNFKGIYFERKYHSTVSGEAQKVVLQAHYPDEKVENRQKIKEIMIVTNINEEMQKQLLQLITNESAEGVAYTQYILQLMIQIISWDVSNEIQIKVIELLIFRICQFEINKGSNPSDEQSIKNQILQLNINESWKNIITQFLLINFKGQILHAKSSDSGNSQSNTIQANELNASGGNEESCIGSCSGSTLYLPHADCSKFCQCSNGRPIVMPCPPTFHWDTKINNCNYPSQVQCPVQSNQNQVKQASSQDSEQTSVKEKNDSNASGGNEGSCIGSCSGSSQYLPHSDCSKFCQCSNGRPIVMPCPRTLYWDTKINNCNYPSQVQCPG